MNGERVLDISWQTIFKIFLAVFVIYIIYSIRDILIWFIFAIIISILFNPIIDFLVQRRIPRVLSVIVVFTVIFGLISTLVYFSIGIFTSEIQNFAKFFSQYFEKISPPLRGLGFEIFANIESFFTALTGSLDKMASSILNALFAIFGGLFSTLFVVTMAVFLSLDEKGIGNGLSLFFPKKYEAYILALWERCQKRVSAWFLTRIVACIFVGLASYIAFLLFNVKYPFSLALLAGALNFIPAIGPIITGALIFLIVALDPTGILDPILRAVFVLVSFTLIQQIENNILTPLLSKKIIGLSPVLVLIAVVIGGKLWGFLGAILAIPLLGILAEFLKDFLKKRQEIKVQVL